MIDLHTHMLPDWDDGAKSWEEMQEMTKVAAADGVKQIAVTPHIFRMTRHGDDWGVLKERVGQFKTRCVGLPCDFAIGAEVFLQHDIIEAVREHGLTLNGTNYFFIEFPSDQVLPDAKDLIFNINIAGYIPIISHPERNAVFSEHPHRLYELVQMNCLAQVTAASITGEMGPSAKRAAEVFLTHNLVHLIASDAHDPVKRPPRLARAVEEAARMVGKDKAEAMVTSIPEAILEDREIGDWGDPQNPYDDQKKWTIKIPLKSGRGGGGHR